MADQRRRPARISPHRGRQEVADRGPPHRRHAGPVGRLIAERIAMAEQPFLHRISRKRIDPPAVTPATALPDLIDSAFLSYNAGRLREACQTFVTNALAADGTVGLALSGALTPAGLGMSCLVPLVEAGFIDWIVSTGANLYHDTHFALGMDLHQARPDLDDHALRDHQVIRIYDVVFPYENLLGTDRFFRTLCRGEAFQRTLGTAEFHDLAGKYLAAREEEVGRKARTLLPACHRHAPPDLTTSHAHRTRRNHL